jgi:hypothetical protein
LKLEYIKTQKKENISRNKRLKKSPKAKTKEKQFKKIKRRI